MDTTHSFVVGNLPDFSEEWLMVALGVSTPLPLVIPDFSEDMT
jgi:hypothetical protein